MADERSDDRLAAIEAKLSELESGLVPTLRYLAGRVGRGDADEDTAEKKSPEPSFLRRALGGIGKLVLDVAPGLILLAVGYVLIQSVELGLEQEKFQADSAAKVREFVQYLYDGPAGGEPDRRRSTAIALGVFGRVAVVPLVLIMEENGTEQINAARAGLISAGRVERRYTCDVLASIVGDGTRAYYWETQKNIAEAIGLIGCPVAVAGEPLTALCRRTALGRESFNKAVRKGKPVPDNPALNEVGAVVATALKRVGEQGAAACTPMAS